MPPQKQIYVYFIGVLLGILLVFPLHSNFGRAEDDIQLFIVGVNHGPGKLNPLDAYDSESIKTIMQVVEGLYRYNYSSPEMEVIPCLASQLGMWSPDMLNLTIALKQGVKFHDGTPFNAYVAKWNFDRLQYWTWGFDIDGDGDLDSDPAGTASMTLFKHHSGDVILNRTEILDEYTLRFVLNFPCVIWEKLLAFVACAIVKPDIGITTGVPYYGNAFVQRITINDDLIGTGPFKLTEYDLGNQVEFDWNPEYHKEWNDRHIRKMIYLIIPDDLTLSLAVLSHAVHWGDVLSEYSDQFDADPDLMKIPRKASVVYFIQMNLYNMKWEYRYASSFAWNHTHWLEETLGGRHYELHVPVPDGMEYHHSGFEGEPYYNLTKARDILLNSPDPSIQTNLTANNLNETSTRQDWRNVAESPTPLAWFNFTKYVMIEWDSKSPSSTASSIEDMVLLQLQDNLKDIGIRVDLVYYEYSGSDWDWDLFIEHYLCYRFGGWGPDYYDPINMIEPLYATSGSCNDFGLHNATWDQKLIDTYSTTGLDRRNLFYEIQEDFCKIHVPTFYIMQLGGSISFNRDIIDETSIGGMLNVLSDYYWFDVQMNGGYEPDPSPDPDSNPFEIPGYEIFTFIGACLGVSTILLLVIRKHSLRRNEKD